ncbi:fructose-1,6-bisphosphatase [Bacillota bacterium]
MSYSIDYLKLLAKQYPTIEAVAEEIVNLSAIINLPKGTEHFLADIHGEHEAFDHVMRNASGVVRRKIDDAFGETLTADEKKELATLVYYPKERIRLKAEASEAEDPEALYKWFETMLYRLIQLCRQAGYKYSRSRVRKQIPENYQYIIEELLHENRESTMKRGYYKGIIDSILEIDRADDFIIVLADLIKRLTVDHLHIIGDIYDRGAGAHHVMNTLASYHSVDIQWGNHDVLWIGAACGSEVCMADVLRISLRYANMETLTEGYGINLGPLVRLVMAYYQDDCAGSFQVKSKAPGFRQEDLDLFGLMQKAIAVVAFKLEGQLALRRPELALAHRMLLDKIDYQAGTIIIEGKTYPLTDSAFPTIDPSNPYALVSEEQYVVDKMTSSFLHSEPLQKHARFLIDKGGMYKIYNGNLLYHGCIPMDEGGKFEEFEFKGQRLKGKALLDAFDNVVHQAYYAKNAEDKDFALDMMWYLWCGPLSPLFGKDRMATFERYFIEEKETHKERKNPYYSFRDNRDACETILWEFGLNPARAFIINGHVPVKVAAGELPIKGGGHLITIDGGFAKAYQKETGIAGYTLIFNSQGMHLVSHQPFETKDKAVREGFDIIPTSVFIEENRPQMLVGDTDNGIEIKGRIDALKSLLAAYRSGTVRALR